MRSFNILFLAGTTILALSSPQPGLLPRLLSTPADTLTLTQPLNITTSLRADWPTVCYFDTRSPAVDRQSCAPLLSYLAGRPDATVPRIWNPGAVQPEWMLQGCRVTIVTGRWKAIFSWQDVAAKVVEILEVCQPPKYLGIGGTAPLAGIQRLMYASFHVQVTGMAEKEGMVES